MILEEATYEAFGYYSSELSRKNSKPILAACELCGEFKVQPKCRYHTFCYACAIKNRTLAEERKRIADKTKKVLNRQKSKRLKINNHHWTLNHSEKGEQMELTRQEHGRIHGLTNVLTDEMSIRREIIYEIRKVIPLAKHSEILTAVLEEFKRKLSGN